MSISNSIYFFDVTQPDPIDTCVKGKVCVLYGEPVQKYPLERYGDIGSLAIQKGAAVVALAYALEMPSCTFTRYLDVTTEGGQAVIQYVDPENAEASSLFEKYKTLEECLPTETENGKQVRIIWIAGEKYLRTDKNCVRADSL